MMSPWHILLSILVPAVLTFGLRALPFLLLNKRELPKRIEYLGNVFPMAIMATLVVYCLKSVPASALQDNLILFAGVAVTAAVHIWKKSSILSITVGTVVYMVLVVALRIISRDDLALMPKGDKIAKLLRIR